MYFICTGHNAFFYEYLRDYLLIYVLNILFRVIDITAPLVYSLSFGIQRQRIYFPYFVCFNLPSWPFTVYILCFIYICIYLYIYPPHLCYRLNTVAEERMVRGCWLHRPLEIPLGTRRSSTSPWGGDDDHLLLHSLNHLRPLLRHASPAVCLVSRFIIPLYLHRTLGQVYFGYLLRYLPLSSFPALYRVIQLSMGEF